MINTQEYILGNIFGICQTIIGYPFDTIKTLSQNNSNLHILQKPYYKIPLKLYKGVTYPLITNCLGMSLIFGNYDYFYNLTNSSIQSGAITGFLSAFIITPFDYFKIHSQINMPSTMPSTTTSSIVKLDLLLKNKNMYYNGLGLTIARETISSPVYFATYHYCKTQTHFPDIANSFWAGGIAGITSWLISYPLDTLKTRRQLYPTLSILHLLKKGPVFNGLGITLLRAFIVNSSCFTIYDKIQKILLEIDSIN